MKHIMALNFQPAKNNQDKIIKFGGEEIRLTVLGCNFDPELMMEIVKRYDGEVDVFALSGVPPRIKLGKRHQAHPITQTLLDLPKESIILDGTVFKEAYWPWALREFFKTSPHTFRQKQIGFISGVIELPLVQALEDINPRLVFADPYVHLSIPKVLKGTKELNEYVKKLIPFLKRIKIDASKSHITREKIENHPNMDDFRKSQIFIGNASIYETINVDFMKGKTVVVDYLPPNLERRFREAEVGEIVSFIPRDFDNHIINFSIAEAILLCLKDDRIPLNTEDILQWFEKLNLKPETITISPVKSEGPQKFAFIIHPLSTRDIFRVPGLKLLLPIQKYLEKPVENLMTKIPGSYYGKITGIKSEENGKEIEGLIYVVMDTPKKLLEQDPEIVYAKLVKLCEDASQNEAAIIGLGAYTKIVGDAGVTVNNLSPIPVTTGNSLSASSTLWAAKEACRKMGFLKWSGIKGDLVQNRAMVVGATGSIGSVSAKLLAQSYKEVVIMAPRTHKLLELKDEIKKIAPNCEVIITTDPNQHTPFCDLVITTTSNQGERVLDIMKVRPGCVICDVSRPFDISEEDAMKRPDVLVIASGEVELPGNPYLNCDIGLEGNVVYACLAETALLLLEGRIEPFTLSREISYQNVKDIYKMAIKHGVRLAQIMGPQGEITEEEMALCREHAIKKRLEMGID
ncbi:MAG: hypothetical protein ACOYL6_04530 [Bacteriovoracaceae bacterium]